MPAFEPPSIQIPAPNDHFHCTFSQTMIGDANNDGVLDLYATTFDGGLLSSRTSTDVPENRLLSTAPRSTYFTNYLVSRSRNAQWMACHALTPITLTCHVNAVSG